MFAGSLRSCGGEAAKHSSKAEEDTAGGLIVPALNLNDENETFSLALSETVLVE